MSLTRKICKGLGLSDEQTESIIEAHTEVTDALKKQITDLEGKASQLESVQKELDTLKNGKDWKSEHDKVKKEFDDFRKDIEGKEKSAKIKDAYKALLTEKKIGEKYLNSVLGVTDFSKMELDEDGKLKNAEELSKEIESKWSGFVTTNKENGAHVDTPPKDNGGGNGANSRAAELAKRYYEQRYGKVPDANNSNNEVK